MCKNRHTMSTYSHFLEVFLKSKTAASTSLTVFTKSFKTRFKTISSQVCGFDFKLRCGWYSDWGQLLQRTAMTSLQWTTHCLHVEEVLHANQSYQSISAKFTDWTFSGLTIHLCSFAYWLSAVLTQIVNRSRDRHAAFPDSFKDSGSRKQPREPTADT